MRSGTIALLALVVPARACSNDCYGSTCDGWIIVGYTCYQMEYTYGCDCSSCAMCSPTAAPSGPTVPPTPSPITPTAVPVPVPTGPSSSPTLSPTAVCPATCYGQTCSASLSRARMYSSSIVSHPERRAYRAYLSRGSARALDTRTHAHAHARQRARYF